jgi:hypothetical protein
MLRHLSHENFIFIIINIFLKTNFDRKSSSPISFRSVSSSSSENQSTERQSTSPRFLKFFQSSKFSSVFNRQLYNRLFLISQYRRSFTAVNQSDKQSDEQSDKSSVDRSFKPFATKNLRPPIESSDRSLDESSDKSLDESRDELSDELSDEPSVESTDELTVESIDESPDESLDEPLVESSDELSVELLFKSSTSSPCSSAPPISANQPGGQQFKPFRSSASLTLVSQSMGRAMSQTNETANESLNEITNETCKIHSNDYSGAMRRRMNKRITTE